MLQKAGGRRSSLHFDHQRLRSRVHPPQHILLQTGHCHTQSAYEAQAKRQTDNQAQILVDTKHGGLLNMDTEFPLIFKVLIAILAPLFMAAALLTPLTLFYAVYKVLEILSIYLFR